MDKTISNKLSGEIADEYVSNTEHIATMMRNLYPHHNNRGMKSKFTRIIKNTIQLFNGI